MDDQQHCKDYLTRFSDYIDGELAPELCAQLESHLKDCTNCTIVLNTLHRTVELYHDTLNDGSLPEGVRARLFTRLSLDDFKK